VSFRFHHGYTALRVWGTLAVVTGLGPPLIVMMSRLGRGGRVVAGAPSAWRPYDCAYDVHIQRQAAPASPIQRTQVQRGIRPAERLAPHEARRRLIAPEAGREGVVQPGQPKRPAYRGRAYERPAYGAPAHDRPNQAARSWNAR